MAGYVQDDITPEELERQKALYGPLTEEAARMAPSPDLIGVHTGFNRGDIIEADAEIGLTDQELDASRKAALAGRGAAS